MTDTSFNGRVRKDILFTFRRQNAASFEFIVADNIADAAFLLARCGIHPETISQCGYLITPLRTDVVT